MLVSFIFVTQETVTVPAEVVVSFTAFSTYDLVWVR